jgi:hypothetical protein
MQINIFDLVKYVTRNKDGLMDVSAVLWISLSIKKIAKEQIKLKLEVEDLRITTGLLGFSGLSLTTTMKTRW